MPEPRALRPTPGQLVLWRPRSKADAKALEFFKRPWIVERVLDSEPTRSRQAERSLRLVPHAADDKPVPTAARWVPERNVWWIAPMGWRSAIAAADAVSGDFESQGRQLFRPHVHRLTSI